MSVIKIFSPDSTLPKKSQKNLFAFLSKNRIVKIVLYVFVGDMESVPPWTNNLTLEHLQQRLKKYQIIIDQAIFKLAETLAPKDPYHNFTHELQVANTCIDLREQSKLDQHALKLLVISALFHDAGYQKEEKSSGILEEKAFDLLNDSLSEEQWKDLCISNKNIIRNLILATKLENRKDTNPELVKILQDADLGCFGYGPLFLLYSVMHLIDEGESSKDNFIQDEEYFLNTILYTKVFISEAGKKFFHNPFDSIKQIKERGAPVIEKAYELSKQNQKLSFQDFQNQLSASTPS